MNSTFTENIVKMANIIFRSVILGAPASGKGTISSKIVKSFNIEHISSGDRLRQNIKANTSEVIVMKIFII